VGERAPTGRLGRIDALLAGIAALEREIDALLEIEKTPPAAAPKRGASRKSAPRARGDGSGGREIGQRIRAARNKRGLTQLDLATSTGIRRPNIARLERGGNTPTIDTLQRIAKALDTTVAALVTGG
jgi:DNA-binding XRE family transcriptional regulator